MDEELYINYNTANISSKDISKDLLWENIVNLWKEIWSMEVNVVNLSARWF